MPVPIGPVASTAQGAQGAQCSLTCTTQRSDERKEDCVDKEIERRENNHNRLECLGHTPWPMPSFAARRCYHRLPCMKMEAPQGVWHLLFFRGCPLISRSPPRAVKSSA